ncbi:MAG: hypothetical protein WC393_05360, partial [Candidatus Nanoarchaeia archaeon]
MVFFHSSNEELTEGVIISKGHFGNLIISEINKKFRSTTPQNDTLHYEFLFETIRIVNFSD